MGTWPSDGLAEETGPIHDRALWPMVSAPGWGGVPAVCTTMKPCPDHLAEQIAKRLRDAA